MKVSIIIPIFNLPDLTRRALSSIPYDEDLEVLAVDDCSTDDMEDVYAEFEDRIQLFRNDRNRGTGYSRGLMLDHCKGEYVYGLDNDDYLITDKFIEAMQQLDGTDMVFVNAEVNGGFVLELNRDTKHTYCAFWSKFVKRDLIGDTRIIDASYQDDWFFNEELMKKTHGEKYTGITAYHYNFPREGSIIWEIEHGVREKRVE